MTKPVLPDDIFAEFQKIERRLDRLEFALKPEAIRYFGLAGNPAFAGTWANFEVANFTTSPVTGRPAGFYRHLGRVYLVGLIKNGVSGTTAFTLPPGYLPATSINVAFPTLSSPAGGQLVVTTDGQIQPSTGTTYTFLDGISFRHA